MSRRTASMSLARHARSVSVSATGAVLLLGWLALPASAEEEIVIRPEMVVRGEEGAVITVATVPVPASLVGQPCDLRVATQNQSSVHPDTSAIVRTGDTSVEVQGVEDSPDGSVLAIRRVALGPEIKVEVELGPDEVSSLGFTVGFECTPGSLLPEVQPALQGGTTTTTAPTTAVPTTAALTTAPSTTGPSTTAAPTTAPPTTVAPGPPTTALSLPTVLPARQQATPELPQAAPARATPANPNFTG